MNGNYIGWSKCLHAHRFFVSFCFSLNLPLNIENIFNTDNVEERPLKSGTGIRVLLSEQDSLSVVTHCFHILFRLRNFQSLPINFLFLVHWWVGFSSDCQYYLHTLLEHISEISTHGMRHTQYYTGLSSFVLNLPRTSVYSFASGSRYMSLITSLQCRKKANVALHTWSFYLQVVFLSHVVSLTYCDSSICFAVLLWGLYERIGMNVLHKVPAL